MEEFRLALSMEIQIAIAVFLLLLLILMASVDLCFSYLSDVSLRRLAAEIDAEKKSSSTLLREILDDRPRFRFALSSVIQIILITFTVLVTLILLEALPERTTFLLALITGLAATVIGRQILPRILVRDDPEKKLRFLLPVVRPLYAVSRFVTAPFSFVSGPKDDPRLEMSVSPEFADLADNNSDELNALIEVGEAEGIIEEKDRELIETMVEFSDTLTGEIMTPRTAIIGIPNVATVREARDVIIREKYSRMPVYRDTIDNIEGIVYVRDLLQAWADGMEEMKVAQVSRDTLFVPETKPASELLRSMQLNHVQIAVVIDEYGGVAGLVTVEDIIEEIVGEIEDEDTGLEEIIEIIEGSDGYYDVLGSTEIDKIERLFDLDLEDEDYNTIAGLVVTEEGHVPKEGEILKVRGLDIEVLKADEKRVLMLRLHKAADAEPDDRATDL